MHVVDRRGRELKWGSPVKRRLLSGHWNRDEVRRISWEPWRGWVVNTRAMPSMPTRPATREDTFEAPDLELIDPEEEN